MTAAHQRNVGVAATALLASSATLVCCVLPAVLVSLGAGAALASLVTQVPQLIWLSERKGWVFGIAAVLLFISGAAQWNARRLPCPTEPQAAKQCARLRTVSAWLFGVAVTGFCAGVLFAYAMPLLFR